MGRRVHQFLAQLSIFMIYGAEEAETVTERERASTKASVTSSAAAAGPGYRWGCKRAKILVP